MLKKLLTLLGKLKRLVCWMSDEYKKKLAIRQAYKRLFDSKDGKLVMEDLEKVLGYTVTIFDPNSHRMAVNEGGRSALLYIKDQMDVEHVIKRNE